MKKWQYEIIVQMKSGKEYLVWTYSKHFELEEEKTDRKQKKVLKKYHVDSFAEFDGLSHSQTAVQWVLGIWRDIEIKRKDRVRDGKFNPHFRINRKNVWIKIDNIKEIYFKMHLLNQGEQPNEKTD